MSWLKRLPAWLPGRPFSSMGALVGSLQLSWSLFSNRCIRLSYLDTLAYIHHSFDYNHSIFALVFSTWT